SLPTPTDFYTLSLHDALPISAEDDVRFVGERLPLVNVAQSPVVVVLRSQSIQRTGSVAGVFFAAGGAGVEDADVEQSALRGRVRSEEHTSELQSRENLVCRLL